VTRLALNPACPQCGGPVDVAEGAAYVRCGYCGAESFVDLNGALLHQVLKPTIGRARVPGLVRARALEAGWPDATLTDLDLVYEPVWEIESPDGRRLAIAARPGPQGRFAAVELPGAERGFIEPSERGGAAGWLEPELAPESAAEVAARVIGRPVAVKTLRLVHHPVFVGTVRVGREERTFRVDAVSGRALDLDWPARATYRSRGRARLATAAMIVLATATPAPAATALVVLIGALGALTLWRRDPTSAGVGS
jgi:ribosomal protein S27AE